MDPRAHPKRLTTIQILILLAVPWMHACGLEPSFVREYAFTADYQSNLECHPRDADGNTIRVYDPDGTTFSQTPTKPIYLGNYTFDQTLYFFEDSDGSYSIFYQDNVQRKDKRQNKQDGRYYPGTSELRTYDPDRETVVSHAFDPDLDTWTGKTTIDTRVCAADEEHCDENCTYIWEITATRVKESNLPEFP